LRDHLGNIRVTFKDGDIDGQKSTYTTQENADGSAAVEENLALTAGSQYDDGIIDASDIIQENHYYAFGLNMEGPWNGAAGDNKYQYNGKEWNDDFSLGWNDYGARFYDPAMARWVAVDLLSEKYAGISPYVYVANNPIIFKDPDGKLIVDQDGNIVATSNGQVEVTNTYTNQNGDGTKTTVSVTVTGESLTIYANDGTPIDAFQADKIETTSAITTNEKGEITNPTANVETDGSANCHGAAMADSKVWIDDSEAQKVLNGDGYKPSSAEKGNVAVVSGKLDGVIQPVHSVSKNGDGTYNSTNGADVPKTSVPLSKAVEGYTKNTTTTHYEKPANKVVTATSGTVSGGVRTVTDKKEIPKPPKK
jgi:RHS repeat-associated protein